jgi:hypothetical protein
MAAKLRRAIIAAAFHRFSQASPPMPKSARSSRPGPGYTAALLPQYAGLLDRAKARLLGDDTVSFTVADGLAACDLIDAVAGDAGNATTLQAP